MKKRQWIIIVLLGMLFIIASIAGNKGAHTTSNKAGVKKLEIETEKEMQVQIENKIEGSTEESQINLEEGDAGDEEDPMSINTPLEVPIYRATKAGFQEFMLEYANTQNYTRDGINYGYADSAYVGGIDLLDSAARISGLSNSGYLVWVLRNTFGICSPEYEALDAVYQKSEKVKLEELEIGDLGFIYEHSQENVCGICIGFEDEEPVFSIMDGSWSEKFPFGSNRLCYLQDGKNEYINQSPPVCFRYFCRPNLPWLDEDEKTGFNLKGRINYGEQDEQNY